MTDVVDQATRSRMMSGIRGKDTRPELIIRKRLHALGFRYRLHDPKLPGKPDILFPKYRAVIFVNGCFWHGHDCHLFKWPSTREDFWRAKISRTQEKDIESTVWLRENHWRVLRIWECALKGRTKLPIEKVIEETISWLTSEQPEKDILGVLQRGLESITCPSMK